MCARTAHLETNTHACEFTICILYINYIYKLNLKDKHNILGVKGYVKFSNGTVIDGAVLTIVGREEAPFRSKHGGQYFRLLIPGNYTLNVHVSRTAGCITFALTNTYTMYWLVVVNISIIWQVFPCFMNAKCNSTCNWRQMSFLLPQKCRRYMKHEAFYKIVFWNWPKWEPWCMPRICSYVILFACFNVLYIYIFIYWKNALHYTLP